MQHFLQSLSSNEVNVTVSQGPDIAIGSFGRSLARNILSEKITLTLKEKIGQLLHVQWDSNVTWPKWSHDFAFSTSKCSRYLIGCGPIRGMMVKEEFIAKSIVFLQFSCFPLQGGSKKTEFLQ